MLSCEAYLKPGSLDGAIAAMQRSRGRFRIVARAADTLPWAREGRAGDVEIPVLINAARQAGAARGAPAPDLDAAYG
jgi:xanthine dehydrogenase FAD-binding subunit